MGSRGRIGLGGKPLLDLLPYPDPFTPSQQRVIVLALMEGLRRLLRSGAFDPTCAEEPQITAELIEELNRMLHNENKGPLEGFSLDSFQAVVGCKLKDWSGKKLEKQPDIAFRSQNRFPGVRYPDQIVFLVECKLVDDKHKLTLYGTEGVTRFVKGEYAWAVSSGMMLGYARNGHVLPDDLSKYFKTARTDYEIVDDVGRDDDLPSVYVTVHGRKGVGCYPPARNRHFRLLHMWVPVA